MKSISNRLLRSVMSVYLVLTLGIFALEVTLQYRQARDGVTAELDMLQGTFRDSIAYSMWNMDTNALSATVSGMLKMPSVSRVIARTPNGDLLRDQSSPDAAKTSSLMPATIYTSRQRITWGEGARAVPVGWLEIESNSSVIVHRMQTSVLVAAVAALVKTAILIFLVGRFFDRILSKPLFAIAQAAGGIDPKQLRNEPLPVKPGPPDELDVISTAINRLAAEVSSTVGALDALNKDLESQVTQRTQALQTAVDDLDHQRQGLNTALEQLRAAQASLVESEKMASLGGLVAGIAHEINTPVGLGLTGSSHFKYMIDQIEGKFRAGELEETDFERFIVDSKELSRSIFVSLEKAAALVRSFKLVAVDQGSDELRRFGPREYINDIVLTHQPVLRRAKASLTLECDAALEIESFPGAWSQIVSNLINNSIVHGFDANPPDPQIHIAVSEAANETVLVYRDNGKGMTEAVARKVFDPFFTTNRQGGGSGLGMHIVYNLVSQQLHGRIQLQTTPGLGVTFTIRLPQSRQALAA